MNHMLDFAEKLLTESLICNQSYVEMVNCSNKNMQVCLSALKGQRSSPKVQAFSFVKTKLQ